MGEYGKWLGYSSEPCPNCGRFRLEQYENGKEVCEKCEWCPQDQGYVDRNKMYPDGE
jgi:ribosomal protein L37AE/L43A